MKRRQHIVGDHPLVLAVIGALGNDAASFNTR